MQQLTPPHTARPETCPLVALLALVALAALLAAALAACGGGVEGTYAMTDGEEVMKSFTLTLEGGEFTLAGPNPVGGEDVEFKGTYTVDGDKISLDMEGEAVRGRDHQRRPARVRDHHLDEAVAQLRAQRQA